MHKSFLGLLLMFCMLTTLSLWAQIDDDFSYSNLNQNPDWKGDTASFEIENNRLKSTLETTNRSFYLSRTASHHGVTEWLLKLELQFNTSSANYVDFVLMSDSSDLLAAKNFYYVRIGNTADEVSLYKKKEGQAAVMLIDGTDGILNRNNNPLLVKVRRDENGNWSLFVNTQGQLSPLTLEGISTDAEFSGLAHTGIVVRQSTASFFQKHFFDLFYMGPEIKDTIPPVVSFSELVGGDSIRLVFDKELDSASATQIANFTFIPNAAIAQLYLLTNNKELTLKLSSPLVSLTQYMLEIVGVKDLADNTIADTTLLFRFLKPEPALPYEIVINEIMATPTPAVGLPAFRYVELYNRSGKVIDLAGFKLSDRTTISTLGSYLLLPDSFLIVCPTTAVASLSIYGTVLGATSYPSFNKTSDDIRLRNSQGTVVHSVFYSDAWYNDAIKKEGGYSLEMIDKHNPCGGQSNWSASIHPSGGTPGVENSIATANSDTIPPTVAQVLPLSRQVFRLVFSETLDSFSAVNTTNYILKANQSHPDSLVFAAPNTVILFWNTPFDTTLMHTFEIGNIEDCAGNKSFFREFIFGFSAKANPFDIIINEIMATPTPAIGLPEHRYIELLNRSNKIIDLEGYTLSDRTSTATLGSFLLFPDSIVLVCPTAAVTSLSAFGKTMGVTSFPSFNKTSDDVYLRSAQNVLVHSLSYTDEWYKDNFKKNGGFSLEMIDPNNPCGEIGNWVASKHPSGGTPGGTNSVIAQNPDITKPELLSAYPLSPNLIELRFNKRLDSFSGIDISNYFNVELALNPFSISRNSLGIVHLNFSENILVGEIYALRVKGLADCSGNEMEETTIQIGLPQTLQRNDILINEVLFNPPTGYTEFVEVYNNSQKVLDIKDLRLGNLNTDGSFRDFINPVPEGLLIFPGQYMAFSTSGRSLCQYYTCLEPINIIKVSSMPSYPQSSGGVVLTDFGGNVIDSFLYNDKMHFKLLTDKKGVSLERIEFDRSTIDQTNWNSAASNAGYATPGFINSQARVPNIQNQKVWLDPKVFSPDGDGYNDQLNIRFDLEKNGFVVNVYVYNSSGIFISQPVSNQYVNSEGVLVWDGFQENSNNRSPFGIYIIMFEAFHEDGTIVKRKLSCTLVGRG